MVALGAEPLPWLRPLSWVYGFGVRARNLGFALGLRSVRSLPVPVVSVGNLSVGGTGKTPLVVWLVERYRAAGLRVGVLARGYARAPGEALNDEGRLLARRFEGLPQVQGADRFAAGRRLLARHAVDLVLLDDGFQHRGLRRDLDICLVDAARPLGGGLLPSGFLREPARGLARADLVVLTGTQEVGDAAIARSVEILERLSGGKPCLACATVPRDVLDLPAGGRSAPAALRGRDCILVAAIAQPERFRRTVEDLGARVAETVFLRDHTDIPRARLAEIAARAGRAGALLVTTEKDEARFSFDPGAGPPRRVLRVDLVFRGEASVATFLPAALGTR